MVASTSDEPVSMLDVSIRLEILKLLDTLKRERNLAMLYVTHDLATARHFSTEITRCRLFGVSGPDVTFAAGPMPARTPGAASRVPLSRTARGRRPRLRDRRSS
jgi:translation initiation factor RLI1